MTLPPKIFTEAERIALRRCVYCEQHVPTQSHHPECDRPTEGRRDAR